MDILIEALPGAVPVLPTVNGPRRAGFPVPSPREEAPREGGRHEAVTMPPTRPA